MGISERASQRGTDVRDLERAWSRWVYKNTTLVEWNFRVFDYALGVIVSRLCVFYAKRLCSDIWLKTEDNASPLV
jgi:hypothetical protein